MWFVTSYNSPWEIPWYSTSSFWVWSSPCSHAVTFFPLGKIRSCSSALHKENANMFPNIAEWHSWYISSWIEFYACHCLLLDQDSVALECPPKAHLLKACIQPVTLLGGCRTLSLRGLMEGSLVVGDMPLQSILGTPLPTSLSLLLLRHHETERLSLQHPLPWCTCYYKAKAMELRVHELKHTNQSQSSPFISWSI